MDNAHKLIGIGLKSDATHVAVFEKDIRETFLAVSHEAFNTSQELSIEDEIEIRLADIRKRIPGMAWMDMSGAGAFVAYSDTLHPDCASARICMQLQKQFGGRVFVTDTFDVAEISSNDDTDSVNEKMFEMQLMNLVHIMKRWRA